MEYSENRFQDFLDEHAMKESLGEQDPFFEQALQYELEIQKLNKEIKSVNSEIELTNYYKKSLEEQKRATHIFFYSSLVLFLLFVFFMQLSGSYRKDKKELETKLLNVSTQYDEVVNEYRIYRESIENE